MLRTELRPMGRRSARTPRPCVRALVTCLTLSVAGVAPALDLGAIEARSHLYEPLSARIALRDVGRGELDGLNVTLGTPAQFELAGVPRENVLKLLEFEVVEQDDGGSHVRVWTREPIIESALTFLVSAEWGRGRAIRGYKLKLSAADAGVSEPPATEPAPAQEAAVLTAGSVESEPVAKSEPEPASPPRSESLDTTRIHVRARAHERHSLVDCIPHAA